MEGCIKDISQNWPQALEGISNKLGTDNIYRNISERQASCRCCDYLCLKCRNHSICVRDITMCMLPFPPCLPTVDSQASHKGLPAVFFPILKIRGRKYGG